MVRWVAKLIDWKIGLPQKQRALAWRSIIVALTRQPVNQCRVFSTRWRLRVKPARFRPQMLPRNAPVFFRWCANAINRPKLVRKQLRPLMTDVGRSSSLCTNQHRCYMLQSAAGSICAPRISPRNYFSATNVTWKACFPSVWGVAREKVRTGGRVQAKPSLPRQSYTPCSKISASP